MELRMRQLGEFWRSSEREAGEILGTAQPIQIATIVCVRRTVPVWWDGQWPDLYGRVALHTAIPPSEDPTCGNFVMRFLEQWPEIRKPALVFCKEGQHRTGIIASVL